MQEPILSLPGWLVELNEEPRRFDTIAQVMDFVLETAERNCQEEGGGGPFGAAIVDVELNLVSLGVNRVVPARASVFHAEMVALLLAQQRLGNHDLGALGAYTLVTSCEPCAMCLGAIPFSGVRRVICGARGEDAEAIGFDEGDKPDQWAEKLRARGIDVAEDLCRTKALALFATYRARGGVIY